MLLSVQLIRSLSQCSLYTYVEKNLQDFLKKPQHIASKGPPRLLGFSINCNFLNITSQDRKDTKPVTAIILSWNLL